MTISTSPKTPPKELDALIVGAGFSGCYLLHKLREELNLNVKIFEAGSSLGGTWHLNCYPGARVDCPVPGYELSHEDVWKNWTWKEKYPSWEELQEYFAHIDQELSLSKDCFFHSEVVSAQFLPEQQKWVVSTKGGSVTFAKYLIPAIGFAAKQYVPDWKGLDSFRGKIYHSSAWPKEGVDVKGKKVGVIGTGSTGVQIAQSWAKEAAETYVFQRTPNTSLPMRQEKLDASQQKDRQSRLALFADSLKTSSGLPYSNVTRNTFDDSPDEREATYERLYEEGGLKLWNAAYKDLMIDPAANREVYKFWAKKTRARINDPKLKDALAPLEPLHAFGTKRPSLEQDYYEQFNKPHVHLVDIKNNPISELQPNGIVTTDGKLHEVDFIAIATGFDSVTGGIKKMGIKDADGADLSQRWNEGIHTYLGLMVSRCPNMFLPYSAHSPSVFSNGPTTIEIQGRWIAQVIKKMESEEIYSLEPKRQAEQAWREEILAVANMTLLPSAKSWYMGANIPGKPVEPIFYIGGLQRYQQRCAEALDNNWEDFVTNK
jgi:cation diffusion facilitator CzcD-associated flavoprotein CzcO